MGGVRVCALDDIGTASIATLLRRFASYRLVHPPTIGQLVDAGFDLLPFRRPHFTVRVEDDGEPSITRLLEAPRTNRSRPVPWTASAGKELTVISVDITCDLMDEDESGYIWTFLRKAREPSLIVPGAIVIAGDLDASAVAEVVEVIDKPAGPVVHLRVLPGAIEDYEALVRRAFTLS